MEDSSILINNFWEYDIWNIDYTQLYNDKIITIINDINRLNNQMNYNNINYNNTIININHNYDIIITDNKYINTEIDRIKKENLNYLKKHAECIPEYHFLLIKIINKKIENYKLNIHNNIIILNNKEKHNNKENNNQEKYNINIDNLDILYNEFIKNIVSDNYEEIIIKLDKNINKNKNIIEEITKIEKEIILIDSENLLKSNKIQHLIKPYIDNYDELFKIWNYGNLDEYIDINCNITMSEYSSNTRYIEPYISLSLTFNQKYELIKIFIEKYFYNYYVIFTISSKHNFDIKSINLINDNFYCIPIIYNKDDIREQDDHLLLFLTYYLNSMIKTSLIYLISNDKFRWYNTNITYIRDIKFMYNYDDNKIDIIIYKNNDGGEIIKLDDKMYILGYNNMPIIDNMTNNEIEEENINCKIIKDNLYIILCYLYKNGNLNRYEIYLKKMIKDLIKIITLIYNNLKCIFTFLKNNTNNDIFNYVLNNNIKIEDKEILLLNEDILNYKIICEIYILLKMISLNYINSELILKIIKLYSIIINIYDNIHAYIHKIRKLSNNKSEINELFLNINCIFLYIKKIGIFKKNI